MVSIRSLGRASRQRTSTLPGVFAQTIQDHQGIINALQAHDAQAAHNAMLTHLEHIEQRLLEEQP
ncbi:hypothetical protein KDH_15350 [Dictyobacter sp. S3.2.2.5]|uniref:GntR C-terminal domain-containing protein n=1 Tax=Dictyobacter halimunensis TaxID=3026934 RepID=A0ABQ6FKA3_9CHLR|nr:hypothetical protein KDH_15350 [Dictyobacter sp. S3.2.2.5]